MLKRFTALLLLIALVSANFSRYFVYAGFELNKKYIASTLCENLDKPWMNCNGHCYFMKKVKAAQDAEKNESRQVQKNLYQEVFYASVTTFKCHTTLLNIVSTPYNDPLAVAFSGSVFRPPQIG